LAKVDMAMPLRLELFHLIAAIERAALQ